MTLKGGVKNIEEGGAAWPVESIGSAHAPSTGVASGRHFPFRDSGVEELPRQLAIEDFLRMSDGLE